MIGKSARDALSTNGYVFLPRYRANNFASEVVEGVGDICRFGSGVHALTPKREDQSGLNNYSGIYGLNAFPMHTDMANWRVPPRILLLRCVVGFGEVATRILDGREIVSALGADMMRRALMRPRRPTREGVPFLRLLSQVDGQEIIRWDREFLQPASAVGSTARAHMLSAIQTLGNIDVNLSQPGDTLLIDNWRMLHGRGSIGSSHLDRVLQRAYLERVF